MIHQIPYELHSKFIPFFEQHPYLQLISRSILKQGSGKLYADALKKPNVALLTHGPLNFIVGDHTASAVYEIFDKIQQRHLIFPQNANWGNLIKKHYGENLIVRTRTKFSSDRLSIERMDEILSSIPKGMRIAPLTTESVKMISDQAKGIIRILFLNLDEFLTENFGFILMEGENIVSLAVAASLLIHNEYEIHIETDPMYQKRGLAMITSAMLIKYSLENGYTPHWDADNPPSARLATKLGFTNPEEYETYIWMKHSSPL